MKYYLLLYLCIFVLFSCSPNKQREALFVQADSLLDSNPDSALILLKTLPDLRELSRKESARYALLLTRATDKAVNPLLPCDSLLNIALHYYDKDDKERAVALLYKGRLEIEMNNPENSITYLQEGLNTLERFPKEIETRRLTLSSLGNLYFNARQYEEAIKMYRQLYDCCITDKDRSIPLNSIGSYYSMTNKEDSAMIMQHKALQYAFISSDSIQIATSELNLSLEYQVQQKLDSALLHARNAIKWLPQNEKRDNYYGNLGGLLLELGENKDSAIYYLNQSIKASTSIKSKASTLLDLYDIKKEQGDYKAATTYLEMHVEIIDSLTYKESTTAIEQLIYDYKRDLKVMSNAEQKKLKETIFGVYADYIGEMQKQYPKLVEDDLLFLCLEDAKVELKTIALCSGYCDTHAISQRKYRIKEKMN